METLELLTKKQLQALQTIGSIATHSKGAPLSTIADKLRISPPSALELVRALETLGLVNRKSGKTKLTSSGCRCLEEYDRHHRIAENLFAKFLDPEESHRAASEIDFSLSHETVERLYEAEGLPETCPHGKPISRSVYDTKEKKHD